MMTGGGTRPLARVVLRSVWRLFWNHIVTDLTSLKKGRKKRVRRDGKKKRDDAHMLHDLAHISRCSRDGWEFWWNSCSSMVSWALVNRLRVRLEVTSDSVMKVA